MRIVIYQCCHVVLVLGTMLNLAVCADEISLKCPAEHPVSFQCPCPSEINSCKFKKFFQARAIFENGTLNDDKYEMNETHAILKKCLKENDGTYFWACVTCGDSKFHLEVIITEPYEDNSWDKKWLLLILIPLVVIIVIITMILLKRRRKKKSTATPEARKSKERVQLFPDGSSAIKS